MKLKKTNDIKFVSLYSTIKMMHGPINIRSAFDFEVEVYDGSGT